MPVRIRQEQGITSIGSTQFTFNLPAQPVGVFSTLIWSWNRGVPAAGTTDFWDWDVVNTPPNQARAARVGGTGNTPGILMVYPRSLLNPSMQGARQFASGRIISKSGGGSEVGPAVMVDGDPAFDQGTSNGMNGYAALTQSGNNTTVRVRRASITSTVLSTIAGWALNDLITIRVTPSVASNFVETFRNGVLVDSFTDSNVLRAAFGTGYPGMFIGNIAIPTASECRWSDIAAGTF